MITLTEINNNSIDIKQFDSKTSARDAMFNLAKNRNIKPVQQHTSDTNPENEIYHGIDSNINEFFIWIISSQSTLHLDTSVDNGRLITETCTDTDYPGIDIEYIDNDENDNEFYRPRVLIENIKNTDMLRTAIWRGINEDYDETVTLNRKYWMYEHETNNI